MTVTDSDPDTQPSDIDRWRELTKTSQPWHTSYCRPQMEAGEACVCFYFALDAVHHVLLAHKPISRPRMRCCPEHGRERIWSTLSYASDVCVDCKLDLETRCEVCPESSWPCSTVALIADRLSAGYAA